MDNEKIKVSIIYSIKGKIMAVSFISVIITMVLLLWGLIPKSESAVLNATENNIKNMTVAYGKMIDKTITESGTISADKARELLTDISIDGVESSYAYLVDKAGEMLYHPTESKIGQPVENSVVKGIISDIEKGTIPEDKVVTYEFDGKIKYAGYHISTVDNTILVVTADEDEILSPIKKIYEEAFLLAGVDLILMIILAYVIASTMTRPIKRLTEIIHKAGDFDFTKTEVIDKLVKRRDETGVMSRAVETMRMHINEVVSKLSEVSNMIETDSIELKEIAIHVNNDSSDNSATAQELAAAMEETAATSQSIDDNIEKIKSGAEEISQLTEEGKEAAKVIMDRAEDLKESTETASVKTKSMYKDVKDKTTMAMEQSKSVEKINELTSAIRKIASQTSLLSLNASIEAARAGEMGKGFAVVADEIGKLASQSTDAVNDITTIVEEVKLAVTNMDECMETTLDFLEKTVLNDYEKFTDTSVIYSDDAKAIESSMEEIYSSMNQLNNSVDTIAEAISGINSTVGESAIGVTDIAGKTGEVVNLTSKTKEKAEESVKNSDELKGIVNRFQL